MTIRKLARKCLHSLGFDVVRFPPSDIDPTTRATIDFVRPYSMTSPERVFALCESVRHVVKNEIPGAIVECGVWRGGSMMAAARTLLEAGDTSRDLWLYDTYEGMSPAGENDSFISGVSANSLLASAKKQHRSQNIWCRSPLNEVKFNMGLTGYPDDRINYVVGPIEETVPQQTPNAIAILRLDTDWYASTRHELRHLFPLCEKGSILIIDDYGAWEGARKAADQFLAGLADPPLLCRIDQTGRIAVLP